MTTHCDDLLLTAGPVNRLLIEAYCFADGWRCQLRHAHPGTLITDCPSETYEKLVSGELEDVVSAHLYSLLAYQF